MVSNISSTGAFAGYGLVQLRSGKDIRFKNLWGEGGVTLRLETGDDGNGYAGNINGSNITYPVRPRIYTTQHVHSVLHIMHGFKL